MLEIQGDLFSQKCDAICIPTNGALDKSGQGIMGAGVAKLAKEHFPGLPMVTGLRIKMFGHAVHLLTRDKYVEAPLLAGVRVPYHIISFPTKPGKIYPDEDRNQVLPRYRHKADKTLPGWMGYANLNIIKHSSEELVELTDKQEWGRVCLPRVGCGFGGLDWEEVRDILSPVFNDRFVIVERK